MSAQNNTNKVYICRRGNTIKYKKQHEVLEQNESKKKRAIQAFYKFLCKPYDDYSGSGSFRSDMVHTVYANAGKTVLQTRKLGGNRILCTDPVLLHQHLWWIQNRVYEDTGYHPV